VPTKLSGSVTVSEFRVADASGKGLGEGFDLDDDTAVSGVAAKAVSAEYFTTAGARVSAPGKGIYIERVVTADGQVTSRKVAR